MSGISIATAEIVSGQPVDFTKIQHRVICDGCGTDITTAAAYASVQVQTWVDRVVDQSMSIDLCPDCSGKPITDLVANGG